LLIWNFRIAIGRIHAFYGIGVRAKQQERRMTEETKGRKLYLEEPIASEEEDKFERSVYANVIADTIANSEGGFNFGISGDWGMGKSSVLKLIEPKLRQRGVTVVWFNPWKIAGEIVSVRRKFLLNLVRGLKKEGIKVEVPENLEKSTLRVTEPGIRGKLQAVFSALLRFVIWFSVLGILPLATFWVFAQLVPGQKDVFDSLFNWYSQVLLIPALAALFPTVREYIGSIRLEQVNPEMETALQFEDAFKKIIEEANRQRNNRMSLAVFIDDLDRCSPRDMMTIFSSIMTFFERKGITFVIAADQRMVETIIQKELGGEKSDAREFVKKIFQVNWIMPPIPYHMQRQFVHDNLPPIVAPVEKVKDKLSSEWIVDIVRREFGGNPRKVRYFMRELEFQVRAVEAKIGNLEATNNPNQEELENLKSIRVHPELLAKILMLRESDRLASEWPKLQQEPYLILREETGDAQIPEPVKTFLESKPLFSENEQNPQYYVFFSGITGFEEVIRAADPSYFIEYSKNGDFEKAKAVIQGAPDIYRYNHLDRLIFSIAQTKDQKERVNFARSFSQNIPTLEDGQNRKKLTMRFIESARRLHPQQPFLNQLQEVDFAGLALGFTNDSDSISEAKRILAESPFTNPDIKPQIYYGFAASSSRLATAVFDTYTQQILEELRTGDRNRENFALDVLKRINGNIVRTGAREVALDAVIAMMPKRGLSSEPIAFQTIAACADALTETQKEVIASNLQKFIDGGVQETIFLTQNLTAYPRITPTGSMQRLVDSYKRRNLQEKQQILSTARNLAGSIDDLSRLQMLESLLEHTRNPDANEARLALGILKENTALLPGEARERKKIFEFLRERVGDEQCQVRKETLTLLGEMRDLWMNDKRFLRETTQKLQVWGENALLSEIAKGLLVQLKEKQPA